MSLPVRKILQEYQESYKNILARFVYSCKERTICFGFRKILQESCRKLAQIHMQDFCKTQDKWSFPRKNVLVLQGYSCKIFLTGLLHFLVHVLIHCMATDVVCVHNVFMIYSLVPCCAGLEITVGHWPFSDQFSLFGQVNPFC